MYRLVVLAIFLVLNYISFGQDTLKSKGVMVFKVYDNYSNVGITYTANVECSDIKEIKIDTIISIESLSEIEYFHNKFKRLKLESSECGVDVRVKLWIQESDKESLLCFGRRGRVMEYNGNYYSYDTELVQRILAKLNKVEISDFFTATPKLKE